MRVRSVKLERFRGIREGELTGFGDLNLFVGKNNSGKSSVVEAISQTLALSHPSDPAGRVVHEQWRLAHNDAHASPELALL